jgi:hypothetical protein
MLNAIMLSVIVLNIIMLGVIVLNIIMLSVLVPSPLQHFQTMLTRKL